MTRLRVVVVAAVASAVARHQEAAVAAAFVRPMPNAAQTPPAAANFAPRVTPLFVRDQFQRERGREASPPSPVARSWADL